MAISFNPWGQATSAPTYDHIVNQLPAASGSAPSYDHIVNQPTTPSGATVPWGDTPSASHVPQYRSITSISLPHADTFLRNVSNLFHPQPPTALPYNSEELRGQSIVANATGRLRQLFKPITQVFHSPRAG